MALIFGFTYTFYSIPFFDTGFRTLAASFIVLWFLVPFLFLLVVREWLKKKPQFYIIPLLAAFLVTLLSGGIEILSLVNYGYYFFEYPFLYFYFYNGAVLLPVKGSLQFKPLTFGFIWLGLFLDLITWFCLSLIAMVIAGSIWTKYGEKVKLKLSRQTSM